MNPDLNIALIIKMHTDKNPWQASA